MTDPTAPAQPRHTNSPCAITPPRPPTMFEQALADAAANPHPIRIRETKAFAVTLTPAERADRAELLARVRMLEQRGDHLAAAASAALMSGGTPSTTTDRIRTAVYAWEADRAPSAAAPVLTP